MATPNHAKQQFLQAGIDLSSSTIKVALGNNNTAYTFDKDNHEFVADVFDGGTTGQEFGNNTGTGYSRQTLANLAVTQDNTDDEGVFDADDVTFGSLDSADIQFIVVYEQVGADDTTPGDDPIVAIYDDDSAGSLSDLPLTTNGGDVTISWNSEGIVNIG